MKKFLLSLCIGTMGLPLSTFAQRMPALLDTIAANNTRLQALRMQCAANIESGRTDLTLPDPEAEVGYKVAHPKPSPNTVSVSVKQTLDWGVLNGSRRQLARTNDRAAAALYEQGTQEVLAEAGKVLTQVIHANRLCAELSRRLADATEISELYERRLKEGDANQMEVNKVRLSVSVARTALQRAETERRNWLEQLRALNGGEAIACADTTYRVAPLPDWNQFWKEVEEKHPQLEAARSEVERSERQWRVNKAEGLPGLTVGYTGEFTKGSRFNGVTLGISLPLWGRTRRKVKQSHMETVARKLDETDLRTQLQTQLRQEYESARTLHATAENLRKELTHVSNEQLLRRALDEGQLSLLDYLLERSLYYEARTALLEAERDAALADVAWQSHLWKTND